MRKFMKICTMVSLGLLGGGLLLAMISGMGRGWSVIPWGKVMSLADFYGLWENLGGTKKEYAMGSGIRKLDIDIGGYYMAVVRSSDENFRVETINEKNFQCYVTGDTLHLEASNTRFPEDFQGGRPKRAVRLYVPAGVPFSDVDITLGAGAMAVEELTADEASVDVGAGTVWGQGMRIGSTNVSIGAGMMQLMDAQMGELSLEVGAGILEFDGSIEKEVDADCGMGSVSLTLKGRAEDFNYQLKCDMGSLTIGGQDYSGFALEKTISHGAAKEMDLACAMGNIEVLFQN